MKKKIGVTLAAGILIVAKTLPKVHMTLPKALWTLPNDLIILYHRSPTSGVSMTDLNCVELIPVPLLSLLHRLKSLQKCIPLLFNSFHSLQLNMNGIGMRIITSSIFWKLSCIKTTLQSANRITQSLLLY